MEKATHDYPYPQTIIQFTAQVQQSVRYSAGANLADCERRDCGSIYRDDHSAAAAECHQHRPNGFRWYWEYCAGDCGGCGFALAHPERTAQASYLDHYSGYHLRD